MSSIPQHQIAFEKAKRLKFAHAALHSELRGLEWPQARALAASLLQAATLDEALASLKVRRFLTFLPWIGEYLADKFLGQIGVFQTAMTCRVRDLTVRQRDQLAGLLLASSAGAETVEGETCQNGHPLNEANLYVRPTGKKECRQCMRDRGRAYRVNQAAERAA